LNLYKTEVWLKEIEIISNYPMVHFMSYAPTLIQDQRVFDQAKYKLNQCKWNMA